MGAMRLQYKLQFNKRYVKDLEKIPLPFRKIIREKVESLSSNPRPEGCTKLQGSKKVPLYRIRAGDYRVVYAIYDDTLVILVIEVGHRKEIYRDL